MKKLIEKIRSRKVLVGIVGVGYVGEALGRAISEAGFQTVGFEIDKKRIEKLKNTLPPNFTLNADKNLLNSCDIICICVPTPLTSDGEPNYSILKTATL